MSSSYIRSGAKAFALASLMIASSGAAVILHPDRRHAEVRAQIGLETLVPKEFGSWSVDPSIVPVLPAPDLVEKVSQIYDETLARTYVNRSGQRVMLSIAYGGDQTGKLRVHRPESCYSGQGFLVEKVAEEELQLAGTKVPIKRLLARLGSRYEPITYWIRLGDEAVSGLLGQRFVQLKYGLTGEVPDGLIFRVSSIGGDTSGEFRLHDRFIGDLMRALDTEQAATLVGGPRPDSRS